MTAKIVCITLMFLAGASSAFAETRPAEIRRNKVMGHVAEARLAVSAAPAVKRGQGFIKRRIVIIC